MTYLAMGYVRETGAVLHKPIVAASDSLAVRIAKEWAHEDALVLTQVAQLVPVYSKEKVTK